MKKVIVIHFVKTIFILTYPIHLITEVIHGKRFQHLIHSKRVVKLTIGGFIMLTGSTMATHPVEFIPHIVWDALAYGLHGYGALPMIKIFCTRLDLETLD